MAWGYQQVGGAWNPRGAFLWGALGSLLVHGLIVATVVAVFHQIPPKPKVVVPVEAITLVPFKPGPAGGGGGRPSPVTRPDAVAPKPSQPPAPHKPPAKPPKPPKIKLAPPPPLEPSVAPVILAPAPPPAITRAKPSDTAITSSRASGPGVPGGLSGTGAGGQGGGRGTGAGGGIGQGQGPGSGAGSALQGYLKVVRQLLEKQKDYPLMARRRQLQGVVVMVFTIGSGGQIESSRISRSSGQDLLDEAAKETIRKVGHFPPFPADLNRQKLTIEIPLAFRLSTD